MVAGTELLIQADSHQDMKLWMESLRKASCVDSSKSLVSFVIAFYFLSITLDVNLEKCNS